MNKIEKIVKDEVMAILPLYIDEKGNSTKIITKRKSNIYIYKRLKTVLKMFARYFILDLKACRKMCGKYINMSNIVPIPFTDDDIFVPIKSRKPISRNDGSFGYFNIKYYDTIKRENDKIYIVLDNNIKIESYQSYKTTVKHINNGKIIQRLYKHKRDPVVREESIRFFKAYNSPATKADIAVLKNSLDELKNIVDSLWEKKDRKKI